MDLAKAPLIKRKIMELLEAGPKSWYELERELSACGHDTEGHGMEYIAVLISIGKLVELPLNPGATLPRYAITADAQRVLNWRKNIKNDDKLRQDLFVAVKQRTDEFRKSLGGGENNFSDYYYTDGIYRFYHGSMKVDYLQYKTMEFVKLFESLLPGRALNETFLQIVSEGTGKQFTRETISDINKNWDRETRPILEAFFHAKYFAEMILKYGKEFKDTEKNPNIMPSGWAAILYLFNLR